MSVFPLEIYARMDGGGRRQAGVVSLEIRDVIGEVALRTRRNAFTEDWTEFVAHEGALYEPIEDAGGLRRVLSLALTGAGVDPRSIAAILNDTYHAGVNGRDMSAALDETALGAAMHRFDSWLVMVDGRLHVKSLGPFLRGIGMYPHWEDSLTAFGHKGRGGLMLRFDHVSRWLASGKDAELKDVGEVLNGLELVRPELIDLPNVDDLVFARFANELCIELGDRGIHKVPYTSVAAIHALRTAIRERTGSDPMDSLGGGGFGFNLIGAFSPVDISGLHDVVRDCVAVAVADGWQPARHQALALAFHGVDCPTMSEEDAEVLEGLKL